MKRYYLHDLGQKSVHTGKPEGAYLKTPPSPARWIHRREHARSFTAEEVEALKKEALQVIEWVFLEHFRGLATCK